MKIFFIFSRLWNYLNIYFLKPFDAVNDTLTASLLQEYNWSEPYIEIGSGDGMFSYIMHGGKFPLWFDRYLAVDLNKKDIFDRISTEFPLKIKKIKNVENLYSVDVKKSHTDSIKRIGFAKNVVLCEYEKLPFKDESFQSVFLYIPHGLKNYELCLKECFRILKFKGRLIVLNYNEDIKNYFTSYNLSKKFMGKFSDFFKKLDNGRFDEITNLSKSFEGWKSFFEKIGFDVINSNKGLSSIAWNFYDIQTRPFLRILICFFNYFPKYIRTFLKTIWMLFWFPILLLFYFIFSNDFFNLKNNCYYSFNLKKISN